MEMAGRRKDSKSIAECREKLTQTTLMRLFHVLDSFFLDTRGTVVLSV